MAKVHLTFTLDRHVGFPPPHIAAAVDINDSDQAEPGEYFRITKKADELKWTGTATVAGEDDDLHGIDTLVVFLANVGAIFTLEMRLGSAKGKVLAKIENRRVVRVPEYRFPKLKVRD